jgi:hypothetical protein
MRRTVDTEFDVDVSKNGLPVDVVPQALDTREMRISRYDLYLGVFEEVFGTTELVVLTDQVRPVAVREVWRGPSTLLQGLGQSSQFLGRLANAATDAGINANALQRGQQAVNGAITQALTSKVGQPVATALGVLSRDYRVYEYSGCFFSDIGRNLSSTGDRVVNVDATLVWLHRQRVV